MSRPCPSPEDARWMAHALRLGRRGLGNTWPNPAVGCVIVKDGVLVGHGWTRAGGRPHAERVALDRAGERARGATAYVTLEPCAHHGRTPPCADALVAAGVARVVVALPDPDPRVQGRGLARLAAAGVAVDLGCRAGEAALDQRGFLLRVSRHRPLVSLKLATSLDGRIATATGESRWITGAEARRRVHLMRASHDAVMVGVGTVRADAPTLTVRGLGIRHQPVRVILDSRLSLAPDGPAAANLVATLDEAPLWLCHGPEASAARRAAWEKAGARLLPCPVDADGRLAIGGVLEALAAAGITRLLCEGGGRLAASLAKADLVDDLHWVTAGKLIGGDGHAAIASLGLTALDAAPRFDLVESRSVGGDLWQLWRRPLPAEALGLTKAADM